MLSDSLKTIVNGVLSINAIDFVKIGSKMGEKKVILIFDDLERANISTSDLLGCINDYCENLHINTIVVANEEKIQSNESDKIEYNEIKEKIIQRTVRYLPDYSVVVSIVIDSMVCDGDIVSQGYKSFLENNKELITTFFSGLSLENMTLNELDILKSDSKSREERVVEQQRREELLRHRPHNIRSLKCAIQDFKRIYRLLDTKQIEKKERWLTTFLAYVLSFRAGLIPESERYGTILSDEKVPILYAGFYNDKYITAGIKQWIRRGMWNQDMLEEELDYIVDRDKAATPEEKVRMLDLLDLDENDIKDGYPLLLGKAYNGEIKLDDYINLLYNRCWARKYNIQLPDIDWDKIREGIKKQMDRMGENGENQPYQRRTIDDQDKAYFLTEELTTYKMIKDFLDGNVLMFEKNKFFYVSFIKEEPLNALIQMRNKRFDRFDVDMAVATSKGFEQISNQDKETFICVFEKMWKVNIFTPDYKVELSEEGFQYLKELMIQFLNKCKAKNLYILEVHINKFIESIDKLITKQKQKLKEIHDIEKEDSAEID